MGKKGEEGKNREETLSSPQTPCTATKEEKQGGEETDGATPRLETPYKISIGPS